MPSYRDNVGESAGVPENLLLSSLCGGFATLPFSLVECREFKVVAGSPVRNAIPHPRSLVGFGQCFGADRQFRLSSSHALWLRRSPEGLVTEVIASPWCLEVGLGTAARSYFSLRNIPHPFAFPTQRKLSKEQADDRSTRPGARPEHEHSTRRWRSADGRAGNHHGPAHDPDRTEVDR